MVRQDKNKYNSAKYRLIVRFTNKRCIAQIVYVTIEGDKVMCHADSTQLEKYGLEVGLKNYASGSSSRAACSTRLDLRTPSRGRRRLMARSSTLRTTTTAIAGRSRPSWTSA